MDISITEVGGFYTVNLNTSEAIQWTMANQSIPSYMQFCNSQFYMDAQADIQEYIGKVLKQGLTVSLNNDTLVLDGETIVFAHKKGTV